MKKNEIMTKLTTSFHKVGFKLKKHSPEILIVAGVVGTVASAVMACNATTKVSAILDETKENLDTIHDCVNNEAYKEKYSTEDSKKDIAIVYAQTGMKLAKLYAPSIALGALSLTSIITSNQILRKRNVALAAAYATIDKSFKDYRGRVVERFGEQIDRELRHGIKAIEIEEKVTDKNGKEKTVKKTVEVVDNPNGYSDYARFFDEASPYWEKNAEYNLMFLRAQQNWANDKLKATGHLFLNEVYKSLGIPETKAGQIVGWVYNPENSVGDNYVDFGIYDVNRMKARDFVDGYERAILLDFNVDGNILDLI